MGGKAKLVDDALEYLLRTLTPEEAVRVSRTGVNPAHFKPYTSNWRGTETSYYNPEYWRAVPDTMEDEAGKVIATREKLDPIVPHLWADQVIKQDPELMYRGMSADELADILLRRQIKSRGDYNFDNQKGLTYFTSDPASAESYANGFAPADHKPNMERPAYIVAAKRPSGDAITNVGGVATHEIGVNRPTPLNDVVGVYRGKTTAFDPGVQDKGLYVAPTARLHWEQKSLDDVLKGRAQGGSVREGYQTKGRVVGDVVEQALKLIFSGSKAVDETGAPVKLYHGTTKDVSVFKPGSYFTEDPSEGSAYTFWNDLKNADRLTGKYSIISAPETVGKRLEYFGTISDIDDPKAGEFYATDNGIVQYAGGGKWKVANDVDVDEHSLDVGNYTIGVKSKDTSANAQKMVDEYEEFLKRAYPGGDGGNVVPAYLNVKNPKEMSPLEGNRFGERLGADPKWVAEEIEKLKAQGYDSIVTTSDDPFYAMEGKKPPKQYVIFEPNQAKSAIGNTGEYDFTNPDITKSEGGSVREGYQTKGRVVGNVVEQALKLLPGSEDAAEAAIRAYHGSPHKFGEFKFTPREIGSGEGAQAYGYGGYFAESEPLAESYTQARDWSYKGKSAQDIYDDLYRVSRERGLDNEGWSKLNAQRGFWERVLTGRSPRSIIMEGKINPDDYGASDLAYHKTLDPEKFVRNEGHMYEVGISADPSNFVDWDKVISEQPEAFKEYMRDHLKKQGYLRSKDNGPRQLSSALKSWNMEKGSVGETPIQSIIMGRGNIGGGTPVGVSKDLQSLGVPGVKFLDSQSRGLGTGTRNYVVFPGNEDLVKIIRSYADGGEVDDDIDDAMRIARAEGGRAGYATDGAVQPPVMMEDAKGNKYDAQGNVIPQDNTGANPQRSDVVPQQNAMFNTAPQNYAQDVQPFIDYAVTPIDRPGMPSEPDLVNVMRIATQVAAEGQPTDSRGEGNLARRREELVNKLYGANEDPNSPSSNQAWVMNRAIDFTPYSLLEVAHDIPYEAGRTGDYKTAAIEGGLNAALTAPVLGAAGRGIKKGYELAKQFPKVTAGIIGSGAATTGSDEAEAGPARWFSKALEVARAIPMEKMTGEQALAMLRKGTSPEELRWMGAEPFLSGQKSVSKDDLVAFLEKNRVQPKEITLGGSGKPTRREDVKPDSDIVAKYVGKRDQAYKEYNEINQQIKQAADAEQWGRVESLKLLASDKYREYNGLTEKMIDEQIARMGGLGSQTKYHDYSTPGGEGYRETLYQYGGGERPQVKEINGMWSIVGPDGEVMRSSTGGPYTYWSEADANRAAKSLYRGSGEYTSGHWDDPNVLFHTRSQTLDVTPPGANRPYKAHNVDETQSDLGQAGRKSGFRDKDYESRVKQINADLFAAEGEYRVKQQAIKDAYRREQEKVDVLSANEEMALVQALRRREIKALEYEDGLANLVEKYRPLREPSYSKYNEQMKRLDDTLGARIGALKNERASLNIEQSKMPAMPFVGSTEGWTDRSIKHELDKALDSEADYFTWSPGDVHAERYGLEKHLSKVEYNPDDGSFMAYDPQGKMVFNESISDPSELDEYVGKELADKIRAEERARSHSIDDAYEVHKDEETGEWTISLYGDQSYDHNGDPLVFGSKGEAKDYLNQMKADDYASNPVSLSGLDLKVGGEGMRGYYDKVYLKRVQEVLRKATGEKPNIEVIEVQTANGPRKQLGVRLTDEMREKARFSDFNKGGRVTGGDTYDNDQAVAHALALTSEY